MIRYEWRRTAEWGECDPAGIVFYPNFYRWFDSGSQEMMRQHGFDQQEMIERHGIEGFPVVETRAMFDKPVHWGDEVRGISEIANWHDKTFTVDHTISVNRTVHVIAYEIRVWAKRRAGSAGDGGKLKAVALPKEFVKRLSQDG